MAYSVTLHASTYFDNSFAPPAPAIDKNHRFTHWRVYNLNTDEILVNELWSTQLHSFQTDELFEADETYVAVSAHVNHLGYPTWGTPTIFDELSIPPVPDPPIHIDEEEIEFERRPCPINATVISGVHSGVSAQTFNRGCPQVTNVSNVRDCE